MKKVLITGGTGLFAINYAIRFKNKYKVYLIQNKKRISLVKNNITLLNTDINNQKNLNNLINKIKPDILIHAASNTNLEDCELNKNKSFKSNYLLTKTIVKACKKYKVYLVFLSTDQLFKGDKSYYGEKSKVNPQNYYSKLKLLSEYFIKKNLKNFLIIRTNFFGWGTRYRNSFSDNVIFNLKKKKYIHILNDVYFNPISLTYLCRVINRLIFLNKNGIFNISSSQKFTKFILANMIAYKFRLKTKYIKPILLTNLNTNVVRPKDMSLKNNKIKKYCTIPKLSQQLNELYKEYKNNGFLKYKNIKING